MTNAELIQKIRAEIERLIVKHEIEYTTAGYVMNELLSFLSTLESENPVPNDLKEAVKNYIYKAADSSGDDWTTDDIRNAFIAGYKLHEANTPLPEDTVLFNKGVEEGKRLMMEEWLKDRDGCFWDGVEEGKKAMEDAILAIIESRLSEIIGDAQPKPILRAELEELVKKINSL